MQNIGPVYLGNNQCEFSVWAPEKKSMALHLVHPFDQKITMQPDEDGYFRVILDNINAGARYFFSPDHKQDFPDPASRYQPEGVHGPSEIIDHNTFVWSDMAWRGLPFRDLILYELHIGTFTEEGTFEAIIPLLDDLHDLGINALEIMPVAQFPGKRNWGYDAVFPYAVQNSYGGPQGLKKLINACHQKGIAVFLDVVYNHIGPEGNYFKEYGPYFTNTYCTPWGEAINFDGEYADGVRDYFSNNPLYWFEYFHLDGLRLDAIHTIFDRGAEHFWELTNRKVKLLEQQLGRSLYMIAESDLNSPRVIQDAQHGGYGFTAQWLDDFHHALYVLLDAKGKSRYADFGKIEQLGKAYSQGFVHTGEYVNFRKRKYGASSAGVSGDKFVVFNLNHDQVGNRIKGERLCNLVDFERLKIAAAAILLAPYIPMLFMGEEYADESPFFYFVHHSDKELISAVQEGRKKEFAPFKAEGEPRDPQDQKTFTDSRLQWHKRKEGKHAILLQWHKELIQLRKTNIVLQNFNKSDVSVTTLAESALILHRKCENGKNQLFFFMNVSEQSLEYTLPEFEGELKKSVDSQDKQWRLESTEEEAYPIRVKARSTIILKPLSVVVYHS